MSPVPLEIRLRPTVGDSHPSSGTLSACIGGDSTPNGAWPESPRAAYCAAAPPFAGGSVNSLPNRSRGEHTSKRPFSRNCRKTFEGVVTHMQRHPDGLAAHFPTGPQGLWLRAQPFWGSSRISPVRIRSPTYGARIVAPGVGALGASVTLFPDPSLSPRGLIKWLHGKKLLAAASFRS